MPKGGTRVRPEMEIRISGLPDGEYPIAFNVPASALELTRFHGDVRVDGVVRKVSTQFFVETNVTGEFTGECDRCLVEVERTFSVPLNLYYTIEQEGEGSQTDELEVRTLHPEQDVIVLDEEVRQTLLLEVPLKVLCRDECAGICAGCGADLNQEACRCDASPVDPRWSKLADIFKKPDEQ